MVTYIDTHFEHSGSNTYPLCAGVLLYTIKEDFLTRECEDEGMYISSRQPGCAHLISSLYILFVVLM